MVKPEVVTQSKEKKDLTLVHMIIVFALMFGFGFIPPVGSMTAVGMKVFGVFLGIMYGWSCCGVLWPSLLGLLALGMTGLMSVKELLALAFSNEMIPFLICMLIIVQMLTDSGAVKSITDWILTRKSLHGRPWLFSFAYFIAIGLLSSFGQAFAAFFLGWSILYSIFKEVGYKPYQLYPAIMIVGTVFSCSCISIMLPFKAMPLILLGVFQNLTGLSVNYGQYMAMTVPTGIMMLIAYIIVCKYILRPDVSLLKDFDMNTILKNQEQFTKRQKATLLAFGIGILCLLIPGTLPNTWGITKVINFLGNTGSITVCLIACILIKVDNQPILNFSQSAKNGVDWGIVIMVTTVLTLASLFTGEATGIKPFLLSVLQPILANSSPLMFIVLIFSIAVLLTNFMNNMVVGVMLIPIAATLCGAMGTDPTIATILIIIGVNLPFLTPAASPATAILFSNKEWLKGKDIFKCALAIILSSMLTVMLIGISLGNLFF